MKPLITALIDTYNHEKYIEQALVSVVEQGLSESELEIVVVDDGSTDKTPEIIQKFAPRVRHIRKANGGQASAFNAGFRESRGEIVAILDGDDWWMKGKLAAVADALERNQDVAAVTHGYLQFTQESNLVTVRVPSAPGKVKLSDRKAAEQAIRFWPYFLMGALTVRREVLAWISPLPEEMVFMADTAIQIAAMAMGTLVLDEPLFYYRHHAHNLYATSEQSATRLQRGYEMTELVCSTLHRRFVELGVAEESVSALLTGVRLDATRARLSRFGGSRLEALRAEMEAFNFSSPNANLAYRAFKYLVVGPATLLLPPKRFYQAREWYARRELGRARARLISIK